MGTPEPSGAGTLSGVDSGWAASAFGLALEGRFPAPGLHEQARYSVARRVGLELAAADVLARAWPAASAPVREWRADGGVDAALHLDDELGYRLATREYGDYIVSAGGERVLCAPPAAEPAWRWQRCLIGQILPLAAVLRGLEVFHASAVSLRGRAVAFTGHPGAGKTSVALRLLLHGARLVTDDVLALEPTESGLLAHPGAGVMSVRHAEGRLLSATERSRLGGALGDDGEAVRTLVEREQRSLPLAAFYFLERNGSSTTTLERLWPPDPRLLLGSGFTLFVRSRERATTQLEVCTRLASSTPLFRARISPSTSADELASAIHRQLESGEAG